MKPSPSDYADHLHQQAEKVMEDALRLRNVLLELKEVGRQGTWLGSRKLGPHTAEYQWCAAVAKELALLGFAQKTGGGEGIMEAPHHGCHLAGRADLCVGLGADFLTDKEQPNRYLRNGGKVFTLPSFNHRHDALYFGAEYNIVLPGRLGTHHEFFDLLNRLKHGRLLNTPVYFVESSEYYSKKVQFLTDHTADHGPRISPADYSLVKVIDLHKVDPTQFVQMLLSDINWTNTTTRAAV